MSLDYMRGTNNGVMNRKKDNGSTNCENYRYYNR